ncbi:MAG: ribonuclease H-like domain-containing protein [Deltaproteobacteria bacterium]|nr:ribonuclease H-like domain-containing protein [Deltaproteobacteria bacterium]MBT6500265.1 ribonuclease H-like domain-containing protein [Deltaproteobacteria bacterium]MBT6614181.1 ribonuclease H-like domain-containing protein [Deltaproteobacteria bacterium]
MIDQTFLHCPGVGPKTENRLKTLGFLCWQDCLARPEELPFSDSRKEQFLAVIQASLTALQKQDLAYLTTCLPPREHWRILAQHFSEATFFDIETTGLSSYDSFTTVISAYHQQKLYTFVYEENLADFLQLVDQSKLLVAFNGNSFDIPFLENSFNIPAIGCPHIDLRWIFYHQGYRGGLKVIEKQLGLHRPAAIHHVDGHEAVLLFERWQRGDSGARLKLIRYCQTDVLTTYLTAGLLLQKMGFNYPLPTAEDLFALTDNS